MATKSITIFNYFLALKLHCATISGMEVKSTSVRIDEETRDRLKRLAEKSGISITKLITLASAYYVQHVEQTGNINVPVKELMVAEPTAKYGETKRKKKRED